MTLQFPENRIFVHAEDSTIFAFHSRLRQQIRVTQNAAEFIQDCQFANATQKDYEAGRVGLADISLENWVYWHQSFGINSEAAPVWLGIARDSREGAELEAWAFEDFAELLLPTMQASFATDCLSWNVEAWKRGNTFTVRMERAVWGDWLELNKVPTPKKNRAE